VARFRLACWPHGTASGPVKLTTGACMAPSAVAPGRVHLTRRNEARGCVAVVQLQVVYLALGVFVLLLSGATQGPETAPQCPHRDGWYRAAEMALACAAALLACSARSRALAERLAPPPAGNKGWSSTGLANLVRVV
jgi:hypothetical protein